MPSENNQNRISLAYGGASFELDVSAMPGAAVLLPSPPPAIPDVRMRFALEQSLDEPAGAPPLSKLASGAHTACIVVSDKTRKYGLALWMPFLLDYLNRAGLTDERITMLVGGGAHGAQSEEETARLLGGNTMRRVKTVCHDAGDAANLARAGETPAGTPVSLNKIFVEADLRIVTGSVSHHYYAGFTGGRKGIVPGVASRETIEHNHSLVLSPGGGVHPLASIGSLEGNPVHEDMVAAAHLAGAVFLVNVVTDGHGAPAAFFAGDMVEAHIEAVGLARKSYEAPIGEGFGLVIASCGGSPKDINFYQSHKSFNNAFRAARPGGTIILLAECSEGIGPADFERGLRIGNLEELEAELRRKYCVPVQTAMATLRKSRAARTILVSKLPPAAARLMNMEPAASLDEALALLNGNPAGAAIMPLAALTVPMPRGLA